MHKYACVYVFVRMCACDKGNSRGASPVNERLGLSEEDLDVLRHAAAAGVAGGLVQDAAVEVDLRGNLSSGCAWSRVGVSADMHVCTQTCILGNVYGHIPLYFLSLFFSLSFLLSYCHSPSVCLSVCLSFGLSVCLSVSLSTTFRLLSPLLIFLFINSTYPLTFLFLVGFIFQGQRYKI